VLPLSVSPSLCLSVSNPESPVQVARVWGDVPLGQDDPDPDMMTDPTFWDRVLGPETPRKAGLPHSGERRPRAAAAAAAGRFEDDVADTGSDQDFEAPGTLSLTVCGGRADSGGSSGVR
jgi:hypothetical protein